VQVVHDPWPARIDVVALTGVTQPDRDAELAEWMRAAVATGFDVAQLPLVRWHLFRLAPQEWRLLQVEHRLWGTDSGAFGEGSGAVSADHRDLVMRAQPLGACVRLAVGQHVDRLVGGHIDHNGSVDVASAEREVIHPDHLQATRLLRIGQGSQQTQERTASGRHSQTFAQPRSSPPGPLDRSRSRRGITTSLHSHPRGPLTQLVVVLLRCSHAPLSLQA
jgi:hypothetical protein